MGYVCKYITKAQEKIGGRWYYSGGELNRPRVEFLDLPFDDYAALTDAHVEVVKFWDAPRESNLIGAIVTGTQSQCKTACAAFERGVMEVVEEPNEY